MRKNAAMRAYWNVKKQFGRAPQSRMANIFNASGAKHDPAAIAMKQKTEMYFKKAQDEAAAITQVEVNQMRQLGEDLGAQIQAAEATGQTTININIPVLVARVLRFVIGFFLVAAALGLAMIVSFFSLFAMDSPGGGGGPGIFYLVEGAINFMMWREPPASQRPAQTIQVENPMRAGR